MDTIFNLSEDGKTLIKVLDYKASHITIPHGVEIIGEDAFGGDELVQSVDIPNTVKEIRGSAFSCCENLQSIDIPDGVKSIGKWAFYYCI